MQHENNYSVLGSHRPSSRSYHHLPRRSYAYPILRISTSQCGCPIPLPKLYAHLIHILQHSGSLTMWIINVEIELFIIHNVVDIFPLNISSNYVSSFPIIQIHRSQDIENFNKNFESWASLKRGLKPTDADIIENWLNRQCFSNRTTIWFCDSPIYCKYRYYSQFIIPFLHSFCL